MFVIPCFPVSLTRLLRFYYFAKSKTLSACISNCSRICNIYLTISIQLKSAHFHFNSLVSLFCFNLISDEALEWSSCDTRAGASGSAQHVRNAHLRLQHKNSCKLLKIATSLCLYLSLASRGPSRKRRKVFISLLDAARCSSSCFAQFFLLFSFTNSNTDYYCLAYALCCFFIDDEETTGKLHFKYS